MTINIFTYNFVLDLATSTLVRLAPRMRPVYDLGLTNCINNCILSLMTNHEHPGKSEPSQPDQPDRPYSELGFATRTILKYIATGRFDPSALSTENLRVLDSMTMKMHSDMQYLFEHGELPPDFGPTPELLQRLESDRNST